MKNKEADKCFKEWFKKEFEENFDTCLAVAKHGIYKGFKGGINYGYNLGIDAAITVLSIHPDDKIRMEEIISKYLWNKLVEKLQSLKKG